MNHWSAQYLGKPWVSGAAGPDAYDCWGLVRRVYSNHYGIELPAVEIPVYSEAAAVHEFVHNPANELWHTVSAPAEGDILLFYKGSWPVHVGVWVSYGVLHSWQASGVVISKLQALSRIGFGNVKALQYHGSISRNPA